MIVTGTSVSEKNTTTVIEKSISIPTINGEKQKQHWTTSNINREQNNLIITIDKTTSTPRGKNRIKKIYSNIK